MLSAWHLLWIIPLSVTVGAVLAGLCAAAERGGEDRYDPADLGAASCPAGHRGER